MWCWHSSQVRWFSIIPSPCALFGKLLDCLMHRWAQPGGKKIHCWHTCFDLIGGTGGEAQDDQSLVSGNKGLLTLLGIANNPESTLVSPQMPYLLLLPGDWESHPITSAWSSVERGIGHGRDWRIPWAPHLTALWAGALYPLVLLGKEDT